MYSEFDCRHLVLPPTRILFLLSQLKNLYITFLLRRFDRPTNCGPTLESSSSTSKRWVHCHTFQDTIWSPKRSRPTMGSRLVVQWRGKISFSSISKEKKCISPKISSAVLLCQGSQPYLMARNYTLERTCQFELNTQTFFFSFWYSWEHWLLLKHFLVCIISKKNAVQQ